MASTLARPAPAATLALAMVAASDAPLLLLDADFNVNAASASFYSAYSVDPSKVLRRPFFQIGEGEWDITQLRSLLKDASSLNSTIDSSEIDLNRAGQPVRRLRIKIGRLHHAAGVETQFLLTVLDVTDARAGDRLKDDLIRENALLLQEIQHRIANSLQIIASVLLQSARTVQSTESRFHLRDAHHRVMSVAAVQRQLASSKLGDVALRPYFTELCASLAVSMIADQSRLSIKVVADDTVVSADVSVGLGLITTELVINALKHAFPKGRAGTVTVGYQARGPNWTLTVKDDGVGMGGVQPKPGLGTGIIEALSKQLKTEIKTISSVKGTSIAVAHEQIAIVRNERIKTKGMLKS